MDAGRSLLADAADRFRDARVAPLVLRDRLVDRLEDDAPLFGILVRVERRNLARFLELRAFVHQQRRVAAIVHDQCRAAAVGPLERLLRAPPVLVERFTFPGEHRRALRFACRATGFEPADDDRGGGVVLGREDVARHPAHVGAKLGQRFDQHRGLNGHVQRPHDAGAGERLLRAVLLAQRHQAGHFLLGEANFLPAELRLREVSHLERFAASRLGGSERMHLFGYSRHSVLLDILRLVARCSLLVARCSLLVTRRRRSLLVAREVSAYVPLRQTAPVPWLSRRAPAAQS